jgi:hypothetical protein
VVKDYIEIQPNDKAPIKFLNILHRSAFLKKNNLKGARYRSPRSSPFQKAIIFPRISEKKLIFCRVPSNWTGTERIWSAAAAAEERFILVRGGNYRND